MLLSHSANLSIEVSLVMNSSDVGGSSYHIMREDCLGLRFREQVQHCRRGWKHVGETHGVLFQEPAMVVESRETKTVYIIKKTTEQRIESSSWPDPATPPLLTICCASHARHTSRLCSVRR